MVAGFPRQRLQQFRPACHLQSRKSRLWDILIFRAVIVTCAILSNGHVLLMSSFRSIFVCMLSKCLSKESACRSEALCSLPSTLPQRAGSEAAGLWPPKPFCRGCGLAFPGRTAGREYHSIFALARPASRCLLSVTARGRQLRRGAFLPVDLLASTFLRLRAWVWPSPSESVLPSGMRSRVAARNAFYFYGDLVPKDRDSHPKGGLPPSVWVSSCGQSRHVQSLTQTQCGSSLLGLSGGSEGAAPENPMSACMGTGPGWDVRWKPFPVQAVCAMAPASPSSRT